MSVIATAVRHLMAAGVTGEALLAAIEEMEADVRAEPKPRSAAAIRQERYRHNKASRVTESDACDVTPPCPRPLSPQTPQTPTPIPPDITTRARKGRIPEGWLPGELPPNVKTLADLWPPGRIERELDGFRDFWLTKPRDYHRENWDRVWWNRIRDIHDRVMRDNRNDRKPSDDDQIRNPYARVAARQAAGAGQSSG